MGRHFGASSNQSIDGQENMPLQGRSAPEVQGNGPLFVLGALDAGAALLGAAIADACEED